jgi:hypothetical protein
MIRRFLQWLRRRKKTRITGIPHLESPILVHMESEALLEPLNAVESWTAVHAGTKEEFERRLFEGPYSMLIAMAPGDDAGATGRAVRRFKEKFPDALTVFHGRDYRISASGPEAAEAGADVLVVGGVTEANLIYLLGTAVHFKKHSGIEPSVEFYATLLALTCAESPFWKMQDLPEGGTEGGVGGCYT